jgi:hypothetical protein
MYESPSFFPFLGRYPSFPPRVFWERDSSPSCYHPPGRGAHTPPRLGPAYPPNRPYRPHTGPDPTGEPAD